MIKKKQQGKTLTFTVETIRKLGATQLGDVAGGGQSNNGCGSFTTHHPSFCLACQL